MVWVREMLPYLSTTKQTIKQNLQYMDDEAVILSSYFYNYGNPGIHGLLLFSVTQISAMYNRWIVDCYKQQNEKVVSCCTQCVGAGFIALQYALLSCTYGKSMGGHGLTCLFFMVG